MPRVAYICTKCSLSFSSEREAVQCEASHIDADHIHAARFRPCETDGPYPVSIVVRMANGVDKTYKRA